jgi:beta-glucosidase
VTGVQTCALPIFNSYSDSWEEESLTYTIIIGSSVRDVRLEGTYDHRGTSHKILDQRDELPSYFSGNVHAISDQEFEALIQRPLPISNRPFYRRNRLRVDMNTTIHELRYAPGWTGRCFSRAIDVAIFWLRLSKKHYQANFLASGIMNLPLRGMSRMSGGVISQNELDGLIIAFNGACFKGFKMFFHSRKMKRGADHRLGITRSRDLEP